MRRDARGSRRRRRSRASNGRPVEENGARCFRGNIPPREPANSLSFEETLRLHALNHEAGCGITPKTSRCRSLGERMDYGWAIEGMQVSEQRAGRVSPWAATRPAALPKPTPFWQTRATPGEEQRCRTASRVSLDGWR
jgi:hypothetical protein